MSEDCGPYEWGRHMAFIKHFYFYLWDAEWGGAFWKANGNPAACHAGLSVRLL